jgi:sortase A
MAKTSTSLLVVEAVAWSVGILGLAGYASARYYSASAHEQGLASFELARNSGTSESPRAMSVPSAEQVDMSTWSKTRIDEYREATQQPAAPAGVLQIPSLKLRVPIYDGTSELNLHRGAGLIEGTARLGESGNVGIAAHRDGFFRALKDIAVGDTILVEQIAKTDSYKVVEVLIVGPSDVSVLRPTSTPTVTLVTCYPFYYVGSAPQRFIVLAQRIEARLTPASSTASHPAAN